MNSDRDGYVIEAGKVRLLGDRVMIVPDDPPKKIGLIVVPDSVRATMQNDQRVLRGKIVAMGPGMMTKWGWRWPMPDCPIGSFVYYGPQFGGTAVKLDGVMHIIMREDYVHAFEESAEPQVAQQAVAE